MTVLVTGANGFIGSALCEKLRNNGASVREAVRGIGVQATHREVIAIGSITPFTDWKSALQNVKQVVHLAARVHVMNDKSDDPLAAFRELNVDATANLARQAAAQGVKRFVFLSSIKVNGEFTKEGQQFTAADVPMPQDPYGISKHEAEQRLMSIAAETGMELVIIRPPLVYGPGVKANFHSMMRWLARGMPLPLASVTKNRRSLVAIDNLVDLIVTCLNHPGAANQTFLVSDGEDLSTAELLQRIGIAMRRPARLFPLSDSFLRLGAFIMRRPNIYQRLCGSLQLDITQTCQALNWTPPFSVNEGLRRAANGFYREEIV